MNLDFEKPVSDIEDVIADLKAKNPEPSADVKAELEKLEASRQARLKEV